MADPKGRLEWESDKLKAELNFKVNRFRNARNLTWALFFLFLSLVMGSRVLIHSFPSVTILGLLDVPGSAFSCLGGLFSLALFVLFLLGIYRYYDLHAYWAPPPKLPIVTKPQDPAPSAYHRTTSYSTPTSTRFAPTSFASLYETPDNDRNSFRSPVPYAPSSHGTPQYAPSYRESPAKSASSSRFPVEDKRSDDECREAFANLTHELGISDKIDSWATNMRLWLAESLVGNVVAEFSKNERDIDVLAQDALKRFSNMMPAHQKALVQSQEADKQEERMKLFMADPTYQSQPAVVRWPGLQRFLQVPTGYQSNTVNRGYVLQRLKALGKGYGLREYTMEAKEGPSDAQIVMHCFSTFCDDLLPNFAQMYFHDLASDRKRGVKPRVRGVAIVQTRVYPDPPYFVLMVQGASEDEEIMWRVEPGKNNIFYALALFVYVVNTKLRGKLQHLKLTDPTLLNLGGILTE